MRYKTGLRKHLPRNRAMSNYLARDLKTGTNKGKTGKNEIIGNSEKTGNFMW